MILLFIIVLLGILVRVPGLTNLSMTHIEMYVPGLQLTPETSIPGPRLTISQIIWSMMVEMEPHPPGYYVFMFVWTKLINTDIFTLRFPSLLFGVASILLTYVLGYLENSKIAALLAAGMLALNGYHILWSQIAKMYMMGLFLGLLSSVLLVLLIRNNSGIRRWLLGFLYLVAVLSGLATTVWVWPIFITHILWVLKSTWRNSSISGLFRLQILILILASPLISLMLFQSRRPSYAGEEGGLLLGLGQFLQMGFLFLKEFLPGPARWYHVFATALLAPLSIFLIFVGIRAESRTDLNITPTLKWKGPSYPILDGAVLFVIAIIIKFANYSSVLDGKFSRWVSASISIPILILFSAFLIDKFWLNIQNLIVNLLKKVSLPKISLSFSSFLTLVPLGIIVVISPFVFLFASRGILLYVPFLVLMISKGVIELASRTKYWLIFIVILIGIHLLSISYIQYSYQASETDFKSLAEEWIPKIENSDLIFIRKHTMVTPILYYLKPLEYHYVVTKYSEEVKRYSPTRIWVLSLDLFAAPGWADDSLDGYKKVETIRKRWIETDLYVRQ